MCVRACARAWATACLCVSAAVCVLVGVGARARGHACAPFYLRPLCPHHVSRHYVINDAICGKKSRNIKCVLIFSTTLISNIFHSKKKSERERDSHKCEKVFMQSTRYFCRILMEVGFF